MAGEDIFIVEDEKIVAEDLRLMLERLGYKVVGSAASGEVAIKKVEETKPQVVLMDIRIKGEMDGVDVAERVVAEMDIPVIYLTAYADETTVDRAKATLPAGYILKPFEEQSLKTTIELALYKHNMGRLLKNMEEWHGGILESLTVAVMAVDTQGHIIYLNGQAETLLGRELTHVLGKAVGEVFPSAGAGPGRAVPSPLVIEKQGRRYSIEWKGSPIKDREGIVTGTAVELGKISPL